MAILSGLQGLVWYTAVFFSFAVSSVNLFLDSFSSKSCRSLRHLDPLDTLPCFLVCPISVSLFFSACFLAFKNSEQGKICSGAMLVNEQANQPCSLGSFSEISRKADVVRFPAWVPVSLTDPCPGHHLSLPQEWVFISFPPSFGHWAFLSLFSVASHLYVPVSLGTFN